MNDNKDNAQPAKSSQTNDCFVIMPISDVDGYAPGHFQRVYDYLLKPACSKAGYEPIRADEVVQTNLIHLDVLRRLVTCPMAICDLSSRNPNVLFELGLRQAFDKPTVLIQEVGTPTIFDISPLRYTEYRRDLDYGHVLEDQEKIFLSLAATKNASINNEDVVSLVKLLSLTEASLSKMSGNEAGQHYQLIEAQLQSMREEFRSLQSGQIPATTVKENKPEVDLSYLQLLTDVEYLTLNQYQIKIDSGEPPKKLIKQLISYRSNMTGYLDLAKKSKSQYYIKWFSGRIEEIDAMIDELTDRL